MNRSPLSLIAAGLLALTPRSAPAELLQLRDGTVRSSPVLALEAEGFRLGDGSVIPRDQVASLDLKAAAPAPPAPAASEPLPKDQPKLAASTEPEYPTWEAEYRALEAAHPGAAATLIRDEGSEEYRPDGTRISVSRSLYRVNKDAAIGYGSWAAGLDPARERVRVVRARTILPGGAVLPLDLAKVKVVDARSSSSNLTNRKRLVWQLEGVQVGAYVEHVVETEVFQPFEPDFYFPRFYFQTSTPVAKTSFTVAVPADRTLHWVGSHLEAHGVTHQEETRDGKTVHTWSATNVAPVVGEPRMPGTSQVTPRISASLQKSWDRFFKWEGENLARNMKPGERVVAKTSEVVAGASSAEEQVAAIYRFLQEEIRYVSVKSGIGSGWSGHPAEETLANGYGDCVDKSVLFCSMLKTLAIEAEPVTIMTNDVRDMETRLPGLDANHCITQIHLGGKSFFLDSTTTDYRYPYFRSDDHGQPATNPIRGEVVQVPLPLPEDNQAARVLRLALDGEGTLIGEDAWTGNGSREAQQRGFWRNQKPKDYPKIFREHYAGLSPGARVLDFEVGDAADLTKPMSYTGRFVAPGYAVKAGALMIVKLPFFGMSFSEATLAQRRYPVDYRTVSRSKVRWEITLPPGYKVKAGPDPVTVKTESGTLELTIHHEPGRVVVERTQTISIPEVPPEKYPAHRAALKQLEALGRQHLFLEVTS